MNRATPRALRRRAADCTARSIPIVATGLPVFPVTQCICDGYPCPFCGAITAPDDDDIWVCSCGWSGVLVVT